MIFLIHFDRRQGKRLVFESYENRDYLSAERARLALELKTPNGDGSQEILLLHAESEAQLKKTHAKYFRLDPLADLLKAGLLIGALAVLFGT